MVSCSNDDVTIAEVTPLNLTFRNLETTLSTFESESTPRDSRYLLNIRENFYTAELLEAAVNKEINIYFDVLKDNNIFTYEEFDVVIDKPKSSKVFFSDQSALQLTLNDKNLRGQHPTHPSLGLLTDLNDSNNHIKLLIPEPGTYNLFLRLNTEVGFNISRSTLILKIIVN